MGDISTLDAPAELIKLPTNPLKATHRQPHSGNSFPSLPAEIRTQILEHVFEPKTDGFITCKVRLDATSLILDDYYSASNSLQALLVCKQFYRDASLLAMSSTPFIIRNLFFDIPTRLSILHPKQLNAIRKITFVADDRHFRALSHWERRPFGMEQLNLDVLTIVLHRSSFWHYLFDFTADIVKLLRNLQGAKKLVIVKNEALVKGSLKTWYNRLIGLVLKVDHQSRYDRSPPELETTWWTWNFDEIGQRIILEAHPAKPWKEDEQSYLEDILPLMETLRESIEGEEWNPDPRARNHYY